MPKLEVYLNMQYIILVVFSFCYDSVKQKAFIVCFCLHERRAEICIDVNIYLTVVLMIIINNNAK